MPKLSAPKTWWENHIVLLRISYVAQAIVLGTIVLSILAPSSLVDWKDPWTLDYATPLVFFFQFALFVFTDIIDARVGSIRASIRKTREILIRTCEWPPGLLERFGKHYPYLTREDKELVSQGLRQFFLLHFTSGWYVVMPSKVVDDLWREFILDAHAYQEFCQDAFGEFLHHTPAIAFTPDRKKDYDELCRVWDISCHQEDIDPLMAERLPLLFALDKRLNIPGGFHYEPGCQVLREAGREAFRQYTA
jgi:hypothetical protein